MNDKIDLKLIGKSFCGSSGLSTRSLPAMLGNDSRSSSHSVVSSSEHPLSFWLGLSGTLHVSHLVVAWAAILASDQAALTVF